MVGDFGLQPPGSSLPFRWDWLLSVAAASSQVRRYSRLACSSWSNPLLVDSSPAETQQIHKNVPFRDVFMYLASAGGLEPPTHSLGNCCSILMSYADVALFITRNIFYGKQILLQKNRQNHLVRGLKVWYIISYRNKLLIYKLRRLRNKRFKQLS